MKRVVLILAALLAFSSAHAAGLVSDISERQIEIRYSFAGADLLLFGAIKAPEADDPDAELDIAVVVRGPDLPTVVRRKERVAGIWVNTDSMLFVNAPGYYAVASTRPVSELAGRDILEANEIGFDHLQLAITQRATPEENNVFRQALVRNKLRDGLYSSSVGGVQIREAALFRTDVILPANVPVGDYRAEVYLFKDGALLSRHSSEINVDKSGFERWVYTFAQEYSALYGLTAVLIALISGWIAGTVARH
ncbi:MAG: TIGR02186 family protein [Sphingomonadales bacterium]|nr:TIGR02186 family protein [Sphingomonadales bacterium]